MIHYIQGKLMQKLPTFVVVEAGGIGYFINISLHTYSQLPAVGTDFVKVHTYLNIKEDSHTLYGFFEEAERMIFAHLISVSGIGPGTARVMLSSMSPQEIGEAIAKGEVVVLQKIKGIGAKSAQRIILEIQDKIKKEDYSSTSLENFIKIHNTIKDEALQALVILGFVKNIAEKALERVIGEYPPDTLPLDKLIKLTLKYL
jgi:holliday junction DNA helicase RuvA